MDINGMKITDVVVYPIKNRYEDGKLYAFAKVVLNDQFIIHGIRIYEGTNVADDALAEVRSLVGGNAGKVRGRPAASASAAKSERPASSQLFSWNGPHPIRASCSGVRTALSVAWELLLIRSKLSGTSPGSSKSQIRPGPPIPPAG